MSNSTATITILGAGYVGLTTAAIFVNCGFKVYVVEPNPRRLKIIKEGKSFFYEKGLDYLVSEGLELKKLVPTASYEESVPNSNVVFSCVGTPDNPDGSSNLSYVFSAAEKAIELMGAESIYIQKSTVPVGTGKKIEGIIKSKDKKINYISNPEFLREGTAIADSLFFDRVVVGGHNEQAVDEVVTLYKVIESHRVKLAASLNIKKGHEKGIYIQTSLDSAELIKVTANAFLALKISFANSMAKLADKTEADINEIMDGVGADARIGRAFLNAGRGYGGGCFPKDVSGLIRSAEDYGVDAEIMKAAAGVNDSMPHYIISRTKKLIGSTFSAKRIVVLGLAFKAGTSDARRSPGVKMANALQAAGARVTTYDPKATSEAKEELDKDIRICGSLEAAVRGCDAVFVATDWPEFLSYDLNKLRSLMHGSLFVDCMNVFNAQEVESAGLFYLGVGRTGKSKCIS